MAKVKRLKVRSGLAVADMVKPAEDFPAFERDRQERYQVVFFDTFDLLLYRAGYSLEKSRFGWKVTDYGLGRVVAQTGPFTASSRLFTESFPDSSLKAWLKKHIRVRAVFPVAQVSRSEAWLRCLNQDRKTVARLCLESNQPASKKGKTVKWLIIHPLRGYGRESRALRKWVIESGWTRRQTQGGFVFPGLANQEGVRAWNYASLQRPAFAEDQTALSGFITQLRHAHRVVIGNLPGIRQGLDSEFLHDYRVTIRQLRSVIGQIDDVLSPVHTLALKQDLSCLGSSTNRMRDLDVYYLEHDAFKAMLPEVLHPGLEQFHAYLGRLLRQERKSLVAWMDGPEFKRIVNRWARLPRLLEGHEEFHGALARQPLKPLVGRLILNRYDKILKAGSRITAASPDSALHALRIQCKKMRYLVEFSQGLFPGEKIAFQVKQFRRLQTTLGRYNDESVHMDTLRYYLADAGSRKLNGEFSAAMGGLITALEEKHRETRTKFDRSFARIQDPGILEHAQNLFGGSSP